jgi:hypothetical protein
MKYSAKRSFLALALRSSVIAIPRLGSPGLFHYIYMWARATRGGGTFAFVMREHASLSLALEVQDPPKVSGYRFRTLISRRALAARKTYFAAKNRGVRRIVCVRVRESESMYMQRVFTETKHAAGKVLRRVPYHALPHKIDIYDVFCSAPRLFCCRLMKFREAFWSS